MAAKSLRGIAIGATATQFKSRDAYSAFGFSTNNPDDLMETVPSCREAASSDDDVQMDTSTQLSVFGNPRPPQPGTGVQQRSRPKPIPPPLILPNDLLTEFAIIATSPRSPLMQKNLPIRKRAYSWSTDSIHSYAKQPPTPPFGILSPPQSHKSFSISVSSFDDTEAGTSSSSPSPGSPFVGMCDPGVPNSGNREACIGGWPNPVWHCFLEGTSIRFVEDQPPSNFSQTTTRCMPWHLADELRLPYAEHGLRLVKFFENPGVLHLRFKPIVCECSRCRSGVVLGSEPDVEVECTLDHPFYTKDGGWSSAYPELTASHYGILCRHLQISDICLVPPSRAEALSTFLFDFTPEDTSAALTLSDMAKHRQEQVQVPVIMSPPASPNKECLEDNRKPKRPMNAFMLFAKEYRKELKTQHPEKDNRAISVLLGEVWKNMAEEKRDEYAQTARVLAEEQKKLYPNCWKRRQSLSKSL